METVSFVVPRDVMVPSLNFSCAPVGTLYTSRSLLCAVCLLRLPYGPGCGDLSACVLFNVRLGSASLRFNAGILGLLMASYKVVRCCKGSSDSGTGARVRFIGSILGLRDLDNVISMLNSKDPRNRNSPRPSHTRSPSRTTFKVALMVLGKGRAKLCR